MSEPVLLESVPDLQAWRGPGQRAVVMTMGALHEGHAELFSTARELVGPDGHVLVTIFVNPLQFGDANDLDRYPRTLQQDLAVCADRGVDAVFAPQAEDIFTTRAGDITVDPGPLGGAWEGAVRPGHFRGVLTIVLKLLNLTQADIAVFGEKDYQQLVLVRLMARAMDVPVRIVGARIVRDRDGLALSSRNVFLSASERERALAIPRALSSGKRAAAEGSAPPEIVELVELVLNRAGVEADYVVVTDPDLGPAPRHGVGRLLIAANVGPVHLLDNGPITLANPGGAA